MLTLLVQAVPVLHFFSEKPEMFYTILDEEKPNEKSKDVKDDKGDDKYLSSLHDAYTLCICTSSDFQNHTAQLPFSPHLELLTPPPDVC